METRKYQIKRFYFLTTYAVVAIVSIAMGIGFVTAEHRAYKRFIVANKNSLIDNRKETLKTLIDSIGQLVDYHIRSASSNMKERVENRLNTALGIATYIQALDFPEQQKKEMIKASLSKMVFGKNYVFIIDTKGNIICTPPFPSLEGKNYSKIRNKPLAESIQNAVRTLGMRSSFTKMAKWTKPGDNSGKVYNKYVTLKKLKNTDWIIGYGEYEDDFLKSVKDDVIKQIESIQLTHDRYIFATTWDGISLTRPVKGQNEYNVQDKYGKYIVRDMIQLSKHGGGFIEYTMPPFKGVEQARKISYVTGVPQWKWYIGSGVYLEDIDAEYSAELTKAKEQAFRETIFVISFLLSLLLLTGFITKILSNKLSDLINQHNAAMANKNDELEELNKSLENKVTQKTSELKTINTSLEDRIAKEVEKNREQEHIMFQQGRLASMGEMLSNIAHQWRQPLNNLGLYIQDMPDAYNSGEFSREYLEKSVCTCMDIIQHMSGTIDSFRDFFKPDKEHAPFCIDNQILSCVNIVKASLENNGIKLITDLNSPNNVIGVSGEYAQVIVNIISNAKDALLESKVNDPFIKITTRSENGMATVEIEDNGGGIPYSIVEKVFEPYFTTKEEGKGTGIGLYFSKMIIEKSMHGTIIFCNTDHGVIFKVSIREH